MSQISSWRTAASDSVSVLIGIGGGTFGTHQVTYPVGVSPQSVAIGDLDGDGVPDLATCELVQRFRRRPDRNRRRDVRRTRHVPGRQLGPVSVAIGDLDGDGVPDLVAGETSSATSISVLINQCDFADCTADLDGSGSVDFGDILAVLAAWGNEGGAEDLDGSGVVGFGDILVVLGAWGPCE